MKKLLSLVLLGFLCSIGNVWATNYYIISSACNVPLTAGMSSASYQILKTNGTTVESTTDISQNQSSTTGLYYNSTSSTYANLTTLSNYSASSSSNRTMQAIKLNNATMTIDLKTKVFSKIDVIYRFNSTDDCKMSINSTEFENGKSKDIKKASLAGPFSSSITIANTYSKDCQVFVILTEDDGAQTPTFSPETGSEIASGSSIGITSINATTVYYKWTTSDETPSDDWSSAPAAENGKITIAAPEYDSETPANNTRYLHAYGEKSSTAGTGAYAQYTITAPDIEAPTLSSTAPAANATNVAIAGSIVLTFSENVVCSTNATLTPEGGEPMALTPVVEGTTVTYAYENLDYNKAHAFNLATNSVADGSGNQYASAISFSFTTVNETVTTPTFTVFGDKAVKIDCATASATIYYKEGAEGEYTEYTGIFIPSTSCTIYAKATKSGCEDSEVASQAVTLPVVGNVVGDLLITMQPAVTVDASDQGDYESHTFTLGNWTMANSANLQNSGSATGFPNMFKVNKGTLTITPPAGVTIKSIKIYGVSNNTVTTASSASAGSTTTRVSSTGVLTPRNYYLANGDAIMSEVVFSVKSPAAGSAIDFKVAQVSGDNSQVRLYVEVYGTDAAESENITPAYEYSTFIPSHNLDFTSTDKLTAYIATAVTSEEVTLTSIDNVPAGTPVILRATETGSAITVSVADEADDVSSNLLMIGDGKTKIGGDGKYDYILNGGLFHKVTEASALAANKAYLHLTAAPSFSPSLRIVFEEDNATNIKVVEGGEKAVKFIENGRILILRDGITYDALGRVIR